MKSNVLARWMLTGACGLAGLCLCVMGSERLLAGKRDLGSGRYYRMPDFSQTGEAPQAETQHPASAPGGATSLKPQLSLQERADIYMARKSYADAVDYYLRALKQSGSNSPIIWNKLGIAYQQQVRYRPARKAYNEAIRRKKDFPEPWNNLGTIYFLQNKYRKSLRYYHEAISLNPTSASFHLNLGTSYYHLKMIKEAVEQYHRALELDPNCLTERSTLGTVVQARGADVDFYFYVAKVFASLGRVEEAVRYLRRAFEDGLEDRRRIEQDSDFQKIAQEPAYLELMKNPPQAIKD